MNAHKKYLPVGKHSATIQSMDSIEMARLGGKARAKSMTAKERRAVAVKAITARWDRYRAKQRAVARKRKAA